MLQEDETIYGAFMTTDTMVYPGIVSGGNDDSDSELDLAVRMDEDSEPPSESHSDSSSDSSSDDENAPIVVTKDAASKKTPRKLKTKAVVHNVAGGVSGGNTIAFGDLSREFVSFLASVKLPI